MLDKRQGTEEIRHGLLGDQPFFAGRMGMTEYQLIDRWAHDPQAVLSLPEDDKWARHASLGCGIHPFIEDSLRQFVLTYIQAVADMNVLGKWIGPNEDVFAHKAIHVPLSCLDVIQEAPWTSALAGKNVAVVHPFAGTIDKQIHNKHKWDSAGWCPDANWSLVRARYAKPVQSAGFESWLSEVDRISEAIKNSNAEIVLIGNGGIGAIDGSRAKEMGLKAVHMGGCLQNLFGIRGARWEARTDHSRFMNEHWARAAEHEKPDEFPVYHECDTNAYY